MAKNEIKFTDDRIRKLHHDGSGKRMLVWDSEEPGLALCITPAGTKSFQFHRWSKKYKKSMVQTLGRYPAISIAEARAHSETKRMQVNQGIDIVTTDNEIRNESTFEELFSVWIDQFAKPHKKSWKEDVRRYNLYMRDQFGRKKLSWFTHTKIREWFHNIPQQQKQRAPKGITISPVTANRALALINTIFNQAAPDILSPCKGVTKFQEQSRDRYLSPDELRRFFAVLGDDDTPEDLRDYLIVSLFTGARRSNVLAMKWSDIDISQQIWTIPAKESKNNNPMPTPLVEQVIELLHHRRRNASSIFVFPSGNSKTGHYVTPTKAWYSLLKKAQLKNVRLHDLRRTLGSYMASDGASLHIIGKALGHKNQKTTEVYARLSLEPVRNYMQKAAEKMQLTNDLPSKTIPLKSGESVE